MTSTGPSDEDHYRSRWSTMDSTGAVQGSKPIVVKFAERLQQRMEHKLSVANLPVGEDDAQLMHQLTQLFA